MSKKEIIPRKDSELIDFAKNLISYATEELASTKWKVAEAEVFIQEPLTDFEVKYIRTLDPRRSSIDVAVKNEAKMVLTKALRNYIQGFLVRNILVDLEDRRTMNLPVYDTTPTNIPPPGIPVTGILGFPAVGLVEIRNIQAAGDKRDERSKHGVRIYYGIVGGVAKTIPARPATGEDLPHSVFTRRNRFRFDFTGENGKEVFFCMRYENSKGQTGPWGKIISSFIP